MKDKRETKNIKKGLEWLEGVYFRKNVKFQIKFRLNQIQSRNQSQLN